jgi:hypothetical protein
MSVTKIIYGSFFMALGVVLPIGFHLLQFGGFIFLPMHIPVLLAGFILGGKYGLLVGLLTPILSHLFTGMPPMSPPMLPMMIVELSCYGLAAGILYRDGRNIYVALIGAMIFGRIGAGVILYLGTLFLGFHIPVWAFIAGGIMKGIPGIVIQLFIIPVLVRTWEKYNQAGTIRGS